MRFLITAISCACSEQFLSMHLILSKKTPPGANLTPGVRIKYFVLHSVILCSGTVSFSWKQRITSEYKVHGLVEVVHLRDQQH